MKKYATYGTMNTANKASGSAVSPKGQIINVNGMEGTAEKPGAPGKQ
jgi:hypothetical protein